MNDTTGHRQAILVALACAALAASTTHAYAERTGPAQEGNTADGPRRTGDSHRAHNRGGGGDPAEGRPAPDHTEKRRGARGKMPPYSGKHTRANLSPTVILDGGLLLPQPQLFSRGSYTVVDVPGGRVASPLTGAAALSGNPQVAHLLATAQNEILNHRYASALRLVHQAQIEEPQNDLLPFMAAQIRFTTGNFHAAANDVAEAVPGLRREQWSPLVAWYLAWPANGDDLVQLSRLAEYIGSHPDDGKARFLRGWQFALLGQHAAAAADLEAAVSIDPQLTAATDVLVIIRGQPSPSLPTRIDADSEVLPSPRTRGS